MERTIIARWRNRGKAYFELYVIDGGIPQENSLTGEVSRRYGYSGPSCGGAFLPFASDEAAIAYVEQRFKPDYPTLHRV